MSKWKWIVQNRDGEIYKFRVEPTSNTSAFATLTFVSSDNWKLVKKGKQNPNFKESLINLETEDYKIEGGILTRIPRKTELDKLIANVKKIDKKAAKWMNKNRYKIDDVNNLDCCFTWDDYPKHDWNYVYKKLKEIAEPQQVKETLKYRVARFGDRTINAHNEEEVSKFEGCNTFTEWLTDWVEVEV